MLSRIQWEPKQNIENYKAARGSTYLKRSYMKVPRSKDKSGIGVKHTCSCP
jgi:hypothetical protein